MRVVVFVINFEAARHKVAKFCTQTHVIPV